MSPRTRTIVPVVCSLLSAVFSAPAEAAYETGGVTKTILSNGVTILVKHEPEAKVAAIEVLLRIGAEDESRSNAGIGQLLAGSILAGTETRSALKLARLVSEVGGNFHALWQPNYIEIYAVTVPDMAEETISLLADSVLNPKLDDAALEYARSAILREANRQESDAFTSAYTALRRIVQRGGIYDRSYLGDAEGLRGISRDALKSFYEKNCSADRLVVSVVGNMDVKQVQRKVEVCFGSMARLSNTRAPIESLSVGGRDQRIERPGPEAFVMIGFPAPGVDDPDYPAMCVANAILGGNKSSLLFRNLREQRGLGYQVGSVYPVLRGGSHVAAYLGMDSSRATPDALSAVRQAILDQVEIIRSGRFSDDDLERAKRYLIGNHALQHERVRDRALYLGKYEALGVGYQFDFQLADKIRRVSREDIARVCAKYMDRPSSVVLAGDETGLH